MYISGIAHENEILLTIKEKNDGLDFMDLDVV